MWGLRGGLVIGLITWLMLGWMSGVLIIESDDIESNNGFFSWMRCREQRLELILAGSRPSGSVFGLNGVEIERKRSPNQGIRRSAINALLMALIFGPIFGLLMALIFGLIFGLIFWFFRLPPVSEEGELPGELFLLFLGLIAGLSFGGRACIQHFVLRLMLYRNRSIPRNYARFLNYCTERLFLQRVGGRYRFVHKLLQERFAELGE